MVWLHSMRVEVSKWSGLTSIVVQHEIVLPRELCAVFHGSIIISFHLPNRERTDDLLLTVVPLLLSL